MHSCHSLMASSALGISPSFHHSLAEPTRRQAVAEQTVRFAAVGSTDHCNTVSELLIESKVFLGRSLSCSAMALSLA